MASWGQRLAATALKNGGGRVSCTARPMTHCAAPLSSRPPASHELARQLISTHAPPHMLCARLDSAAQSKHARLPRPTRS